jgi:cytochrome c556
MEPRRIHWFGLGSVVAAFAAALLVSLAPSQRIAPDPHLNAAERLPESARAAVATQMHAHARGMLELTSAATVLDYDGVRTATQRLLEEPRIARPVGRDASELNAALPPRFFDLQDQLRDRLQRLSHDAAARDANALAGSLAATTRTCIQCHDAYLTGR